MTVHPDNPDKEADIVLTILHRVMVVSPGFSEDLARQVELEMRQQFGGSRVFVPKKKKHPSFEQRERAIKDGMSSMSTPEVTERNGISRATLYRWVKRGASR